MRLAPIPMFFFPDTDWAIHYAGESSRTTHAAAECVDACRLFALILVKALTGESREKILFGRENAEMNLSPAIQAIATGTYREKSEGEIKGSGYVVKSLEAALWCFLQTDTFRDAILMAANLGDDADTTAAVCGQIAGAYYGDTGIPAGWLEKLCMREKITAWADGLLGRGGEWGESVLNHE